MNALARIAHDMAVQQLPVGERAYELLRTAATEGTEITLSDHELVLATTRAHWHDERLLVQHGLSELELRTALSTVHEQERRAA